MTAKDLNTAIRQYTSKAGTPPAFIRMDPPNYEQFTASLTADSFLSAAYKRGLDGDYFMGVRIEVQEESRGEGEKREVIIDGDCWEVELPVLEAMRRLARKYGKRVELPELEPLPIACEICSHQWTAVDPKCPNCGHINDGEC